LQLAADEATGAALLFVAVGVLAFAYVGMAANTHLSGSGVQLLDRRHAGEAA
jgi:hypothetical protein